MRSFFFEKDTAISILKDTKLNGVELCNVSIACGVSNNTLLGIYYNKK